MSIFIVIAIFIVILIVVAIVPVFFLTRVRVTHPKCRWSITGSQSGNLQRPSPINSLPFG